MTRKPAEHAKILRNSECRMRPACCICAGMRRACVRLCTPVCDMLVWFVVQSRVAPNVMGCCASLSVKRDETPRHDTGTSTLPVGPLSPLLSPPASTSHDRTGSTDTRTRTHLGTSSRATDDDDGGSVGYSAEPSDVGSQFQTRSASPVPSLYTPPPPDGLARLFDSNALLTISSDEAVDAIASPIGRTAGREAS